ncbi:MAG TPA: PP2C family protein-serine/threonine phosphatase [Candidatus Xenobia bacterium]
MFFGSLDLRTGALTYVNAGHPAPVLFHPTTRTCDRLDVTGGIIGVLLDMEFEQKTIELEPGSLLAMFTDGVTEASRMPDPAGDGGVCDILRAHPNLENPKSVVSQIYKETRRKAAGKLRDDLAIVVLRRVPAQTTPDQV